VTPIRSAPLVAIIAAGVLAGCGGGGQSAPEPAPTPTSPPTPAPSPSPERFFGPDTIWNKALPADARLDPRSPTLVHELVRQLETYPLSIATTAVSVPIYKVKASEPHVRVILDQPNSPLLAEAFASVPLPDNARAAPGTDGNLVVWQPSSDTMWDFWRLVRKPDGWHASWGGKLRNASQSPGYYRTVRDSNGRVVERPWWGAPAAKFALVAGVMTIDELRRGSIDHALTFAIAQPRRGVYSLPAQATDGPYDNPDAIPEGAHFRLDPKLDLDKLHLSRTARIIATALQRYGMILENTSRGFVLRAQDPAPTGHNPYMGDNGMPGDPGDLFEARPAEILAQIPWEHMQLMPMQLRNLSDRPRATDGLGR
jgi:hypothetical protein